MAFSNINELELGKLLQIVFSDGLRNQISEDYRDWEYVSRYKYGNTAAREYRYLFQTSYGPSAVQYRNPGTSGRTFPRSRQLTSSENTAKFKELNATIELEYNVWDRARKSPEKYAEPLAAEISAKTIASKRRYAADFYGDGTGVIGTVASIDEAGLAGAGSTMTITLSTTSAARGHIGFCEFGDFLTAHKTDGTNQTAPTGSTDLGAYEIVDKDESTDTITVNVLNSSLAPNGSITASGLVAGDLLYRGSFTADAFGSRDGQQVIPDLTGPITADFGTISDVCAGLESLAANDGRLIHGVTMTGATSGTRKDLGGNAIDVKDIQAILSNGKRRVGQGAYAWKMMSMSPETHDALIESRETDRRFTTVEDNTRGVKYFAYMHGGDTLETYTSEYCPKNRMWFLPENKSNKDRVLEYVGSDFETVKGPGMSDFNLKPASAGGHENAVVSYLQAIGVLVAKHPAAILSLSNFTNS